MKEVKFKEFLLDFGDSMGGFLIGFGVGFKNLETLSIGLIVFLSTLGIKYFKKE